MANTDYAIAVTNANTIHEMIECTNGWREMVYLAEKDSAFTSLSQRSGYWTTMTTALGNHSVYADSLWKKQIAKERLTIELIRKRDTV